MPNWIDPSPVDLATAFESLDLSPLIAQALIRRGIETAEAARAFLDPQHRPPASPYELPGMEAAVKRILKAIRNKDTICVWGDFDVDGQTSTAVLVQTLRALGSEVDWHIPVRAISSHGVHIPELTEIIDLGTKLVLTCDTGITAHEAVDYASHRGVDFVITDHHELGGTLPDAVAVVNPKLLPESHSMENLAGVGVAYKLAEALLETRERGNGNQESPHKSRITTPESLLDLVALGLIADVALLKGETRALAQKGLDTLRNSERLGLKTIAELAEQPLAGANEDYVGFVMAPRLNALGRLGDSNPAVELLTTSDPSRARVLATQLEGLNIKRRLLTNQVYQAAEAQLRADPSLLSQPVIVLEHPSWPGGVIGIVASRLKERYQRPVILFSTPPDGLARGSARSIEGLHITEAIATQANLLDSYGGHPMAAGLSLPQENLPAFRKGLGKAIEKMLGEFALEGAYLQIDAWMPLENLNLDLADSIEQLAPFGAGNPPLTFATRNLSLVSAIPIGRGQEHFRLVVRDEHGQEGIVLWWNSATESLPEGRFDLAYSLRASTFRGQRGLSLQFLDFRVIQEQVVEVKRESIEAIDLRNFSNPIKELSKVHDPGSVVIYVEGADRKIIDGADRYRGEPSKGLAIYTTPPGPSELKVLLETIKPQKVYLIAHNPPAEKPEVFLSRLAGMAKYAITQRAGQTRISELAAATAQREITLRLGLEWLAAGGHVNVSQEDDIVLLSAGGGIVDQYVQKELFVAVKGLLEETDAYRKFINTTPNPSTLFE